MISRIPLPEKLSLLAGLLPALALYALDSVPDGQDGALLPRLFLVSALGILSIDVMLSSELAMRLKHPFGSWLYGFYSGIVVGLFIWVFTWPGTALQGMVAPAIAALIYGTTMTFLQRQRLNSDQARMRQDKIAPYYDSSSTGAGLSSYWPIIVTALILVFAWEQTFGTPLLLGFQMVFLFTLQPIYKRVPVSGSALPVWLQRNLTRLTGTGLLLLALFWH